MPALDKESNPLLAAPSTAYGAKADLRDILAAAPTTPMPANPAAVTGPPQPMGPGLPDTDMFAPTARPGEPPTAGIGYGPGNGPPEPILGDDPDMIIRAAASVIGTPGWFEMLGENF